MAHADYDCCAVCSSKMDYNGSMGEEGHKEQICSGCLKALRKEGVSVLDPDELVAYMESNPDTARATLLKLRFEPCYYSNRVDTAFDNLPMEKDNG